MITLCKNLIKNSNIEITLIIVNCNLWINNNQLLKSHTYDTCPQERDVIE